MADAVKPVVKQVDIGRLSMRVNGDKWVAYYVASIKGGFEDRIWLGEVHINAVRTDARRERVLALFREIVSDVVEDAAGIRPSWPNDPATAPDSERIQ